MSEREPLPDDWEAPYTGPSMVKLAPAYTLSEWEDAHGIAPDVPCGFCGRPSVTGLCAACEAEYDALEALNARERAQERARVGAWIMRTLELIAGERGHRLQRAAIHALGNMRRQRQA